MSRISIPNVLGVAYWLEKRGTTSLPNHKLKSILSKNGLTKIPFKSAVQVLNPNFSGSDNTLHCMEENTFTQNIVNWEGYYRQAMVYLDSSIFLEELNIQLTRRSVNLCHSQVS